MRSFIDIITSVPLMEAKLYQVEVSGSTVKVWKNPTHNDFAALLDNVGSELRGIVDPRGDLYLFDAYVAIHYQVAQALGIEIKYEVILHDQYIEGTTVGKGEIVPDHELMEIRTIKRAYGPWAFEMPTAAREPDADMLFMEGKKKKRKKPHKRRHTSFFGYLYGMPSQSCDDSGGAEAVSESVFYRGEITPKFSQPLDITVLKNPTRGEMTRMLANANIMLHSKPDKELRGFLGNDLLVWDAYVASHDAVGTTLNLSGMHMYFYDGFFKMDDYLLRDPEMKAQAVEEIVNHPMIIRVYGQVEGVQTPEGFIFRSANA